MKDFKKLSHRNRRVWIDAMDSYLMLCCKLNLISSACNAICWDRVVDKYIKG